MDVNNIISVEKSEPKVDEKSEPKVDEKSEPKVSKTTEPTVSKTTEPKVSEKSVLCNMDGNNKIIDDIISDIKERKGCSNTNKNLTIKIIDKIKNELTKEEIKKEIDIHLLKPLYNEINTNVLPILSSKLNNNLLPLVYNQIYEKVFPHYLTFIILLTVIIILLIVLLLFMIGYK